MTQQITVPTELQERFRFELQYLYGPERGEQTAAELIELLQTQPTGDGRRRLTERDAVVIAYPDHLREQGKAPLKALHDFAGEHLADTVTSIHLLPFCPYTSDDGFSVSDYEAIKPEHGSWEDVRAMGRDFRLMFDFVLNHLSASHEWFQAFLRDEAPYTDYFIVLDPDTDVSSIRRPRTSPLLTPFKTPSGVKHVWTTFSADQIDLNYGNPQVLLDMIKVLLRYVREGAYMIRMDAVGFMWKELGTESIHLPQVHSIVRVFRKVLDAVAPDVRLVTETNVPHAENITYFGQGVREAQLIYNFALPPLMLHTLHSGDATALTEWARTLASPTGTAFFNFTASHDGVGVTPVRGLLPDEDVEAIIETIQHHGGRVSYKSLPDGSTTPYELNVNYLDGLSPASDLLEVRVDRFMVSQAVMLALRGVPGIYLHSLLGSGNWPKGVAELGHNRAINREKLEIGGSGPHALNPAELKDASTRRGKVFGRYRELLAARRSTRAFHPQALQEVLDLGGSSVFALRRATREGDATVLALHNVTSEPVDVSVPDGAWRDLLGERAEVSGAFTLAPYQVAWLGNAGPEGQVP
jgi:sucrose phosphorylase